MPGLLLGASWGPDNTIVYANSVSTGLWRVSADGGTAPALTAPDVPLGAGHRFPYQLPDRSGVLFSTTAPDGRPQLGLLPAGAEEWEIIADGDARFTGMRYLSSGHLVFGQGRSISIAGFDLSTGRLTGEPRSLITDAASSPVSQHVYFSVSDGDTLVYVPAKEQDEAQAGLAWLGEDGQARPFATVPGGLGQLRLSTDGQRVALAVRVAGQLDPWVYDVASGRGVRLTRNAEGHFPVWAPDGQRLVIGMNEDLYEIAANGTGSPRLLLQRDGDQTPTAWSTDGRGGDRIVFTELGADGTSDVLVLSTADGAVTPLLVSGANERSAIVSPDREWLAYVSDETGRPGAAAEVVTEDA